MSRLALKKVQGRSGIGFVPADRAAEIEAEKFPFGRILKADIRQPRNSKHNGLMFQFFTYTGEALNAATGSEAWDQNKVRRRLQIMTGNADLIPLPAAVAHVYGLDPSLRYVAFEPRSMAFDSMCQDEASKFYEASVAYILTEFGDVVTQAPDWQNVMEIVGVKA